MKRFITAYSRLYQDKVMVNGRLIFYQENILKFADFIKAVFKQEKIVYPKFYKMDAISKLGFLATELVLQGKAPEGYLPEALGVVFSNSSSSLDTDIAHHNTIRDRSEYFPSPSVFVYTLPNIVIGEVCIRNNIKGENAFLITESFNATLMKENLDELFDSGRVEACLCGWIEVMGENCNAMVALVEKESKAVTEGRQGFKPMLFNTENLNLIMQTN